MNVFVYLASRNKMDKMHSCYNCFIITHTCSTKITKYGANSFFIIYLAPNQSKTLHGKLSSVYVCVYIYI